MNANQKSQWVDELIQQVLAAIAHASELREAIVFKGAWILNSHLLDNRHSMDIDANTACEWAAANPLLEDQRIFFERTIQRVVSRHFEGQSPVRFRVTSTKVEKKPRREHPRNWTAFWVRIAIHDAMHAEALGMPSVEIDIAAPEELGPEAVETIDLLGAPARVYSLHRVAGEKLRAYLTSLPEYRKKMGGGERLFRVKDLYDLTRILRARPLTDHAFWKKVGAEFQRACQSRLVDCQELSTFTQDWRTAQKIYESDPLLRSISLREAEVALTSIARFLEADKIIPVDFPLQ